MSDYRWTEKELAEEVGVDREQVREMRQAQGWDARRVGTSVRYSEKGRGQVLEAFSVKKDASRPEVMSGAAGSPSATLLARTERRPKNTRLVVATLADGQEIRVRVKHNRNFTQGFQIPVRLIEGDLYELDGRCPRWPGKW